MHEKVPVKGGLDQTSTTEDFSVIRQDRITRIQIYHEGHEGHEG